MVFKREITAMGKNKIDILNRLKRIEGQVRGVAQMVTDDRYCIDILHQVQAVKAALAKAESEILRDHAACCVAEAIASGDEAEQRAKFSELIDLFEKVKR
jgi:DNA-binding FrmR family transcriptional regulator